MEPSPPHQRPNASPVGGRLSGHICSGGCKRGITCSSIMRTGTICSSTFHGRDGVLCLHVILLVRLLHGYALELWNRCPGKHSQNLEQLCSFDWTASPEHLENRLALVGSLLPQHLRRPSPCSSSFSCSSHMRVVLISLGTTPFVKFLGMS